MRTSDRTVPRAAALLAALAGLLLTLLVPTTPAHAAPTGFRVQNGRLLEASGNDFVMRGVNHAHTWYADRLDALDHIKAKGANTVRVVLSSGDRWTRNDTADVANVVAQCKRNRLICVLEVHDTTGYGEQSGAVTLSRAADYWIEVRDALAGQEDYIVVNIGNEPHGNTGYSRWTDDTKAAIQKLRAAGFDHTLMVDAPNWGQDWAFTMRDNAASVFAADPDANTVFSIHMYGVFDTAAEVSDYLGRFVAAKLPVVVGEFGHDHSDGNPDEDAVLSVTRQLGIGYLGWSWSGNGGGVEYLDMVENFDPARTTSWGQRLFDGPDGIAATSEEAAIYRSGSGEDTTAPTAPGAPVASAVTSSSVTLTWGAATDAVGVTGYDVVRVAGGQETVVASASGATATVSGLAADTSYTFAVYARDAAGNRSARSATVTVTTASGAAAGSCAVAYRVTGEWPGGFQGEVVVRNTGSAAVDGWTLRWTFPAGQRITSLWGGTVTQSGAEVSVAAAPYTATIPPSGSVALGFTGTRPGTNSSPTVFLLNGAECSAA
ncbi:cellulase family glycosylhydrolase [Streptomyces griseoincarnatus]|uniref:cellulase family glycosylhydrolase n=1 Tax=Streptomyces sp. SMS_SU21 TaxID=2069440 RepID=UPI000C884F0E|nr:cellulase family glycosylhydrolase [Streptomyces sp. SMS_SU21]MCA2204632.1 cellulase family glycosylhydrolase [Streptomyces sp. SMS_SU21]NEA94584.1 cellulase family glycosylhydrolase [Actinospica acidiphila]